MKRITVLLGISLFVILFSCKKDDGDIIPSPIAMGKGADTTALLTGARTITDTATKVSGTTTTQPSAGNTATTPSTGTTTTPVASPTGTTTTQPATGATVVSPSTGTTTTPSTTTPSTGTTATTTKTGTTTPSTGTTTTTTKTGTTTPSTGTTTTKTTKPATVNAQPLAGVYGDGVHDDTQALQALLNKGNVTLTAGKTYKVTGLSVTHAFNLNGATIDMSGSRGYAIVLFASGASITNGNIVGQWSNTSAGNPNGVAGIAIGADNVSVSYINITSFAAYGISAGAYNSPSITYCTIQNTGYIGFYYDPESKSTTGGTFSNNTVDRSMLPAATVSEGAIDIRGSVSNTAVVTAGWTISNNVLKMPSKPTNLTAECMEVRNMTGSVISGNTCTAGSIGCSAVDCTGLTISANNFSGSSQEAIEFADSKNSSTQNNVINSSLGVGILLDGSTGSAGIQLNGDKVSGTTLECIHAYKGTQSLTVSGCTLTSATNGTFGINLQGSSAVKIQNSALSGNGLGNVCVEIDNCPGNVTLTGGTVSNFKSSVISIYNSTSGLVTNNVSMSGVKVTGTPKGLVSVLNNGGLLGANISVVL